MTTTVEIDSDFIKGELSRLQDLPTHVSSWLVELSIDSTDREAVWVWAYLTDKSIFKYDKSDKHKQSKRNKLGSLRAIIAKKVKSLDSDVKVYIRFRGADEKDHEDE